MAACPSKSSFLRLPKEIRLEIYRYLFSSKYIRCKSPYRGWFGTAYYTYPFHKQILRTSRQVHQEAMYIYQVDNLFICFTTNHPSVWYILWEWQGLLFLTHGDRASYFRCRALEVYHFCPIVWNTEDHEHSKIADLDFTTCLLVSDQLPNLLGTLRSYSEQGDLFLAKRLFSILVSNSFDRCSTELLPGSPTVHPRIQNLLDPFKILYEVESLVINALVDQEYKQSIVSSATQQEPTVAELINAASAIRSRGDQAFRKQPFEQSLCLYTSAIHEFQVNHRFGEYTGELTTEEYAGMSAGHSVRMFKIRLHSNLIAPLLNVGEYKRAIDHTREAIRQIVSREGPPEEWVGLHVKARERANPFFWGGIAYEGLGDLNRAIYGVGEALSHNSENKRLKEEYKRLEEEIDRQRIIPTRQQFGKGTNWWVG